MSVLDNLKRWHSRTNGTNAENVKRGGSRGLNVGKHRLSSRELEFAFNLNFLNLFFFFLPKPNQTPSIRECFGGARWWYNVTKWVELAFPWSNSGLEPLFCIKLPFQDLYFTSIAMATTIEGKINQCETVQWSKIGFNIVCIFVELFSINILVCMDTYLKFCAY